MSLHRCHWDVAFASFRFAHVCVAVFLFSADGASHPWSPSPELSPIVQFSQRSPSLLLLASSVPSNQTKTDWLRRRQRFLAGILQVPWVLHPPGSVAPDPRLQLTPLLVKSWILVTVVSDPLLIPTSFSLFPFPPLPFGYISFSSPSPRVHLVLYKLFHYAVLLKHVSFPVSSSTRFSCGASCPFVVHPHDFLTPFLPSFPRWRVSGRCISASSLPFFCLLLCRAPTSVVGEPFPCKPP